MIAQGGPDKGNVGNVGSWTSHDSRHARQLPGEGPSTGFAGLGRSWIGPTKRFTQWYRAPVAQAGSRGTSQLVWHSCSGRYRPRDLLSRCDRSTGRHLPFRRPANLFRRRSGRASAHPFTAKVDYIHPKSKMPTTINSAICRRRVFCPGIAPSGV